MAKVWINVSMASFSLDASILLKSCSCASLSEKPTRYVGIDTPLTLCSAVLWPRIRLTGFLLPLYVPSRDRGLYHRSTSSKYHREDALPPRAQFFSRFSA